MRWWRHLISTRGHVRKHFPQAQLDAITAAVADAERERRGQIVVALEAALPLHWLGEGVTARRRAEDLFGALRVWDTDKNNGVLLYWLLADRAIEIIADRNAARQLTQAGWDAIAADAARRCGGGRHGEAILQAIAAIKAQLSPDADPQSETNELPDRPVLL